MRQAPFVVLGALFLIMGCGLCGTLSGCGSSSEVSSVTTTPEAKKADEGLQEGMKEFMQSKVKTKTPRK